MAGVVGVLPSSSDGSSAESDETLLQTALSNDGIVCYSLGEFQAVDCYEIAIAWVDRRWKGCSLALSMYAAMFEALQAARCPSLAVDLVAGTLERLYARSPPLRWLRGLEAQVVLDRHLSYQVITSGSNTEQFEKFVFAVWPLASSVRLFRMSQALWTRVSPWTSALPVGVATRAEDASEAMSAALWRMWLAVQWLLAPVVARLVPGKPKMKSD
jgi:hypothetical protein